jgi:hypothetical protein
MDLTRSLKYLGDQTLSVTDLNASAGKGGVDLAVPEGARFAKVDVIAAIPGSAIRYTRNAELTLSASTGGRKVAGSWWVTGGLEVLRMFNETSSGCSAYIEYFG